MSREDGSAARRASRCNIFSFLATILLSGFFRI